MWVQVKDVMSDLELTRVAHSMVSQISGGQRKRVNIAMEMVCDPQVLFLGTTRVVSHTDAVRPDACVHHVMLRVTG